MFIITVTFIVKSENADLFQKMVLKQAENSLSEEPCCRVFEVSKRNESTSDDVAFFLYEAYDTEKNFTEHLETKHFLNFNEESAKLILSKSVASYTKL